MAEIFAESYLGKLRHKIGNDLVQLPGTRAILENAEGKILLQLRGECRLWGLPAGSPEIDDDICGTIKREIFEETGLSVDDLSVFGYASDPLFEKHTFPNGDRIHNFSLMFFSRSWSGELIVDGEESLDLRFFDPIELPEMLANHKRSVHAYLKYKESKSFQFI